MKKILRKIFGMCQNRTVEVPDTEWNEHICYSDPPRKMTREDMKLILDKIHKEYDAALQMSVEEMKTEGKRLMQAFLDGDIDLCNFVHGLRAIDSNVKRILDEGDEIVMKIDWPLWLFGFCNHYFDKISILYEHCLFGSMTKEDVNELTELIKIRIREALPGKD